MILYTPIPLEAVFPEERPEQVFLERNGRFLSGVKMSSHCGSSYNHSAFASTIFL